MESKEFFSKLMSSYLWKNLGAMAAVVILLCAGLKFGIDIYTHHGEAITVPDLRHRLYADAEKTVEDLGLQIVVADTGYVKTLPADCILEQIPDPGQKVKSGHIIYVTVNASSSPTLVIPDIVDNSSYREAKAKLIAMGFKLAEPKFIPGEKDWVYGIMVNGRSVGVGDRVPVDAKLVILVGDGLRDEADSVAYIDPMSGYPEEETTDPSVEDPAIEEEKTPKSGDKDEFEVVTGPQ